MDMADVEYQARLILEACTRYGGPVDRNQVVDTANNNDLAWRTNPVQLRLNTRAMDLLIRAQYVVVDPNNQAVTISAKGRLALSSTTSLNVSEPWIDEWIEEEQIREALDDSDRISANTFSKLRIQNWRQFSDVIIDFHSRLTIITGANAAGKTTVLNLLAPHFNWQAQLLVRSTTGSRAGIQSGSVGELSYSNGGATSLVEPPGIGIRNAGVQMPTSQSVPGIFINSHRSVSSYQALASLPPRFSEAETLFSQFSSEIQTRYLGGSSQFSPLYRMKEALFASAVYGEGNSSVRPDTSASEVWNGFQAVLGKFLPSSLSFERLLVDSAEILIKTASTEFPLEAASGGLSAMIELSWQIYLRNRNQPSFTVCIDEPENHLHPELQRTIVPNLMKAFPDVSFIVATHSPFVVTSTKDANVYALAKRGDDQKVSSRLIDNMNFSATADETLSSVLGLDTTIPLWAETELSALLESIGDDPTADDLRHLRSELEKLGLDQQFPSAVRAISRDGLK